MTDQCRVDVQSARDALDSLDDYARMAVGVDAYGPRGMLERFIDNVAELIEAANNVVKPATNADPAEWSANWSRLRAALSNVTASKSEIPK